MDSALPPSLFSRLGFRNSMELNWLNATTHVHAFTRVVKRIRRTVVKQPNADSSSTSSFYSPNPPNSLSSPTSTTYTSSIPIASEGVGGAITPRAPGRGTASDSHPFKAKAEWIQCGWCGKWCVGNNGLGGHVRTHSKTGIPNPIWKGHFVPKPTTEAINQRLLKKPFPSRGLGSSIMSPSKQGEVL